MWLTNRKTGAKFNTDWADDDAKRKHQQITANREEGKALNKSSDVKYEKMLSLEEKHRMINDFCTRTGIDVSMSDIHKIPDDTFEMIFDTVENQLKSYGKKNFELRAIVCDKDDDYFWEPDNVNALACMSYDGTLRLNFAYFKKSRAELDAIMQNASETRHHPNGDATSIIEHELGHARWNKAMTDEWAKYAMAHDKDKNHTTVQDWSESYNLCVSKDWLINVNRDLYQKHTYYAYLVDRFGEFSNRVRNSEYLKKRWGGNVNTSLYGLVNPEFNGSDAISRYARTDIHEMMAEAWADVMHNGKDASFMSKQVVQEFLNVEMTADEMIAWKEGRYDYKH